MPRLLASASLLLLLVAPAWAQGDLESERASLADISSFGVRVTVEAPRHLSETGDIRSALLVERVTQSLEERDLSITRTDDPSSFLHVHVNVMSLDNGIVPFAVEADFHQPARLSGSGRSMAAVTWSESVLGVVSPDRLDVISESVLELVGQFARDYEGAN